MKKLGLLFAAAVLLYFANSAFSAEHKYIGVKKCSICHKSDAKGSQYGQWLSTKHAKAYETLGRDAAKVTAQKAGVSGNPPRRS